MRRLGPATSALLACAVCAVAVLAGPGAAGALEAAGDGEILGSKQARQQSCGAAPRSTEAPGVAQRERTATERGLFTAELEGPSGSDWDLAIFSGGEAVAASTAFGARESATTWTEPGEQLLIQACRLDGPAEQVELATSVHPIGEIPVPERITMESVPISGPGDLQRLDQLGFDVTHDVSDTEATVVLYSTAQRALLASAGFRSNTLIEDLAAADRADRRAESRSAGLRSDLPSARDSYRQYVDYTDEMKALADANPGLVREITLGDTFEGRPIQGIEIAEEVRRTDDGRPVYLNLGGHHAREWPSSEFPMEYARDLVQRHAAGQARVVDLLDEVRVVIVPVVNVDGFIASRSHGVNPLTDDNADLTLAQILANEGAYIRKNCRPTLGDGAVPCAQRTGSGVDLNRNYGYYWGGPGSETNPATQSYRGTGPFSEPESEAVHRFSSGIHPTVLITNHTFTDTGWWLRQPGFQASFFPQEAPGYSPRCTAMSLCSITPDEPAMKALGDAMGDTGVDDPTLGATGWPSDLSWELGSITGATEDWNYFAQGTYGYTPEARGQNFHANYQNMVVTEYLGDASHPGEGVREAFMLAGEEAGNEANHGVIEGTVPPGATLTLRKEFEAPTFNQQPLNVDEVLETTLSGPASGSYQWHVMPSDRPQISGGPAPDPGDEQWTMTCQRQGQAVSAPVAVEVERFESVTVDWAAACGDDPVVNTPPVADFVVSPLAPLTGQQVNFISTSTDPDGAIATTEWDLDDDGDFDDAQGLTASRTFAPSGSYDVSVQVTDDDDASDVRTRTVVVSDPAAAPQQPGAQQQQLGQSAPARARCGGREATIVGTPGRDRLVGTPGDDVIASFRGKDRVFGRGGDDVICGGGGRDLMFGGRGADTLFGGKGRDRLRGGRGRDRLRGGRGADDCRGGKGRTFLRACA